MHSTNTSLTRDLSPGASAIFLFAAVHRDLILPILKRPEGLVVADLLANSMIVYPVYNIVKRGIKAGSTFSTSSFCNNASEWGVGFIFALYTGFLISAIGGGATEDPRKTILSPQTQKLLSSCRIVSGVLLMLTSIGEKLKILLNFFVIYSNSLTLSLQLRPFFLVTPGT